MEFVLRWARTIAVTAMLAVAVGIALAATAVSSQRGMCGDGDFRPSCEMFAAGLIIYGMIGVSVLTTLLALVSYAVRRYPPVLIKTASAFSAAAVGALLLPVWLAGDKIAGAILLIMAAPIVLILLAGASVCVLLWLGKVAGGWIELRAGKSAGLAQAR